MARKMKDPKFRQQQWEHRYASHITEINKYIDELSKESWLPYVAPHYGGKDARLLSVLSDPGPKTCEDSGSGFLSMENDDPTAERIFNFFLEAGIGSSDIVPWNAYPWYINAKPSTNQLKLRITRWLNIIRMMPKLKVIMLHGNSAKKGWKYLLHHCPFIIDERRLTVIETYHTSSQALWCNAKERENRLKHLKQSFLQAAYTLNL